MIQIPKDKLYHTAAGALVALFSMAAYYIIASMGGMAPLIILGGMIPVPMVAGVITGAVKECCDWQDNQITPGMHGVEFWDFAATALPGTIITIASLHFIHGGF